MSVLHHTLTYQGRPQESYLGTSQLLALLHRLSKMEPALCFMHCILVHCSPDLFPQLLVLLQVSSVPMGAPHSFMRFVSLLVLQSGSHYHGPLGTHPTLNFTYLFFLLQPQVLVGRVTIYGIAKVLLFK